VSDTTKFGPPKGMRDWLPKEVQLRQKLIRLIESQYQLYSFQPIDTPVMENIEVLQGKGGGENEKLMFKILKRGEELKNAFEEAMKEHGGSESGYLSSSTPEQTGKDAEKIKNRSYEIYKELPDMGLRFDMTVPLARYYANHSNDLPKPFRCSHIGPVWRADRPQKGRFREFYQCDIDIVGGASDSYEVELLLATDRVLKALNIGKFKIRISDKGLLNLILRRIGTPTEKVAPVAVCIDKMDKMSFEDVKKEISGLGLETDNVEKIVLFLNSAKSGFLDLTIFKENKITELGQQIESIQNRVKAINPDANVVFDPLLVRGFDYYTGPVFEINVEEKIFTSSIGGGGRYDGLIEKLGGPKDTPAVGLSLGFERILAILLEKDKTASDNVVYSRVFIANNGQAEKDILALAEKLRSTGIQVETALEQKKIGQQLEGAQKNGLEYAITAFEPGAEKFKVRQLSTRQDKEMTLGELKEKLNKV
jgi:histidyl-tRNA synthetase